MIDNTVLGRYLMREGVLGWLAVTFVLLSVMLATRFARYLAQAAGGLLPQDVLWQVVALSSLQYLVVIVPVSLMLGLMLALGRLYRDQEITAMAACGLGLAGLYRPFVGIAVLVAVLSAALSLQIGPWAGRTADRVIKDARRLMQYTPFEAGRFTVVGDGEAVFYTERMSADGASLGPVFIDLADPDWKGTVVAGAGSQRVDPETGERRVLLKDGARYAGTPGQADWEVARFAEFGTRVTPPDFIHVTAKRKLRDSIELLGSADPEDQAELQWRLSVPVTVLLLTLVAVPLSHTSPRQGRYGKVVLGLLVYLVYINLLGLGQALIADGRIDPWLGMWWAHGLMAALALWLIGRRNHWWGA